MKQKIVANYLAYSMIYFFYFFSMAAFGSMLAIYLDSVGKSSTEISLIVSASGIFGMILGPMLGLLYDRTGWRKKLSLILLALSAVTGLAFAFTRNTVLLFLLNGLSMSLLGGVNPMCEQIAASSPYRYGVLRLWGAVGYAAGTQVCGLILEYVSPIWTFALFAVTALLTGGFFHWTGLQDTEPVIGTKAHGEKAKPVITLPLVLFAVFSFLFSGITSAGGTYVPLLLKELLGSTSAAGTVLFLGTLMEIPLIFLSNRFMDKLSGRTLLTLNTGLLIVQGLACSFIRNPIVVCVILILTKSVTTMLAIMVTLKVVMILTGGQYATTALSLIATVKSIGGVVLTNLAGVLANVMDLRGMFSVLLGASVVTLLLSLVIRVPDDGKTYFTGDNTK